MANPILLKYNSVAATVPTAGALTVRELALNTADGRLFTKTAAGAVVEFARKDSIRVAMAGFNITGGGTITVNGSGYLLWSARYIVISNGNGTDFSTSGYFDINCPTSGTITGVGGAANATATAAGIPLAGWQALYYILPIGSGSGSVAANFRIVTYSGALSIPPEWVLICVVNTDIGAAVFNLPHGITLRNGESYSSLTHDTRNADLLDGQHGSYYAPINAPTFTGAAKFQGTFTSENMDFRWKADTTATYPAVIARNDATTFYLLVTNPADGNGTFNIKRPFYFNTTSGLVGLGNGVNVAGALSTVQLAAVSGTPTGTPSTTGGTVPAGTVYAKIVAVDHLGYQTTVSTQSAAVTTTGATSSIVWNWTVVAGAASYYIYVGASNAQANYFTSTTNTYTQTVNHTSGTAGAMPTVNQSGAANIAGHVTTPWYVNCAYLNMSHAASGATTDTVFYSSVDNYVRKNNATGFKTSLALNNVTNESKATMFSSPTFTTNATSPIFTSTVAIGTAPLTVTSTTKVTNLNADLIDGLDSTQLVYGGANNATTRAPATWSGTHITQYKSGFWDGAGSSETWLPNANWWWGVTLAHNASSPTYLYAGQLIIEQVADPKVYVRSLDGAGTPNANPWRQVLTATTLTSSHVTTALGYTPASPAGLASSVISTNTTATAGSLYVITASLTLTLPASPTAGNLVRWSDTTGLVTCVIARNGQNIMGLAQDLTLNTVYSSGQLMFADATRGWVLV